MSPVAKEMIKAYGKVTPGFEGFLYRNVDVFGGYLMRKMSKKSPGQKNGSVEPTYEVEWDGVKSLHRLKG